MTNEMSEAIFAAWAARVEGGEELEFADLVREHPTHADALTKLHADWKLFAPLLGKVVPGLLGSDGDIVVKPLSSGGDDESAMPTDELVDRLGIKASNSGRYRFRSVIGRGGFGVVLKVWDTKLCRPLAMKVVLGRDERGRPSGDTPKVDSQRLTRFVDEARIASQLNHPGIVPVHELGADERGRAYFTMKLVKGDDLSVVFEHVKTGKDDWNQTRALNVLQRVCEAMAFAHDKGVVHRDLKPANIMVGKFGEVYVMDWGLARVMGEEDHLDLRVKPPSSANASVLDSLRAAEQEGSPLLTVGGQALGTPAYMSPEQARGDVDAIGVRSDVYAIGAMLYELVAGRMPYVDPAVPVGPATMVDLVKRGPPESLTKLAPRAPAELIAIAEKAMERDAAKRYASTLDLGADLRAFLEGHVVAAYETGTWAETRKWVRRNRALAASLALAVITSAVGAVAFGVVARQSRDHEIAANEASAVAVRKSTEALWQLYVACMQGADASRRSGEALAARRQLDAAPKELRDWEWHYLDAASDTSLMVLDDRPAQIVSAAFSPRDKTVVTAMSDGTAILWNYETGQRLSSLTGHTKSLTGAEFGRDGKTAVTSSVDLTARVWNVSTCENVITFDTTISPVHSATISFDGKQVATLESDEADYRNNRGWWSTQHAKSPGVWDATYGCLMFRLEGHSGNVSDIAFSGDSKLLLTASADHTAIVWSAETGAVLLHLTDATQELTCARFSPDDRQILTGSRDGAVRRYEASTGRLLGQTSKPIVAKPGVALSYDESRNMDTQRYVDAIADARFSPDGSRIATLAMDGRVAVFDAYTDDQLIELRSDDSRPVDQIIQRPSHILRYSPNGLRILTVTNCRVCLWDAESGALISRLEGHTHPITDASFSLDGTRILAVSKDGTARVWDSNHDGILSRFEGVCRDARHACISPDGNRIVLGSTDRYWGEVGSVCDTSSGELLARLEMVDDYYGNWIPQFSPDGRLIAAKSPDLAVGIWDAVSGARLWLHERPELSSVTFSPDSSKMLILGNGGPTVLDCRSGKVLWPLGDIDTGLVVDASFFPDSTSLATWGLSTPQRETVDGYEAPVARIVNIDTRAVRSCSAPLPVTETSIMNIGTFARVSPNGAFLVTRACDGDSVLLWDTTTCSFLKTFPGEQGDYLVGSVFASDGHKCAAGTFGERAYVWDVPSGKRIVLEGHTSEVGAVSFCAANKRIITLSGDGSARIWDTTTGSQLLRVDVAIDNGVFALSQSADGQRIVTSSSAGALVLDSVSYRTRFAEREKLWASNAEAAIVTDRALNGGDDWSTAYSSIVSNARIDESVRHSALNQLTQRANAAVQRRVHLELERVASEAERVVDQALLRSAKFSSAYEEIDANSSLDKRVKNTALQILMQRCDPAAAKANPH